MTNRLSGESSPYLQQHAENPVDWYPWGEEALAQAQKTQRPIHLSIGYAACHWCHVMAHESFEDPAVAEVMNEHFINIKVDRQERPDLDEVYQKVVQMMGQSGGWPLTVFLSPSAEPFYGGTYFPPKEGFGRPSFVRLLLGLSDAWKNHRDELLVNVEQFRKGYRDLAEHGRTGSEAPDEDMPAQAAALFAEHTDPNHGGLGGAPKFPNPTSYDLILRVYQRTRQPSLLHSLQVTLAHMADGGIYDHLGGGFSRYSVDERWAVPHFEKMLYDQGQLTKLYADAFRATGKPEYKRVFEETIAYVLRDMTHPEGGFYASEDADSEGEEGRFYVWTPEQVHGVLGQADGEHFCRTYGVTARGNFERGTTVLSRASTGSSSEQPRMWELRQQLLRNRCLRTRPGRDENILTGWNALMIQGLCAAYQATGTLPYLAAAERSAQFIEDHLLSPTQGLLRVFRDGKSTVRGFLDDHAFLANAMLDLYESCFEKRYLERAIFLVDRIFEQFWDDNLYFTPKDTEPLVHRPLSPNDSAWPSGISTTLFALSRLHALTLAPIHQERAAQLIKLFAGAASKNPFGFAHFLSAWDFSRNAPHSVVVAGSRPGAASLVEIVHRSYLPRRVLAFADDVDAFESRTPVEGRTAAYVCRSQTCHPPITDPTTLAKACAN